MYETYGSINASINRTLEILNLTQANYTIANQLFDDVSFKVSEHCIVICNTCNNWPPTLEIGDNFYGLYDNVGVYNFQNPLEKIKVLFQNEGGTGIVVGLANPFQCGYIDGCTVVKNYVSNSDLTRSILTHELGHNLGCDHTLVLL
jgi:Metallo-peptidase family M12B Reprolysin-like